MKKIVIFFFVFNFCFLSFSQTKINSQFNKSYRDALVCFESGDYGNSLKKADDAIMFKKNEISNEVKLLENCLVSKDVKACGDKINLIKKVLLEKQENQCVNIIDYYLGKYGDDLFENSIKKLIQFIKTQSEFPEAQKLIGDIYKIEGEYTLAEEYYSTALKNAAVLDVPDEKYEILYTLAELSKVNGDYNKMEERLLNISGKSDIEKRKSIIKSAISLISKNQRKSVDKFFELYRYDDFYSLKAFCLLSDYYESIGEFQKALEFSTLAVITGFTKFYNVIEKRNLIFEYTTLENFLKEVSNYSDLVEWGKDNYIWKSFYNLCNLTEILEYNNFSLELLIVLAKNQPEKYYQQAAVLKLDNLKK